MPSKTVKTKRGSRLNSRSRGSKLKSKKLGCHKKNGTVKYYGDIETDSKGNQSQKVWMSDNTEDQEFLKKNCPTMMGVNKSKQSKQQIYGLLGNLIYEGDIKDGKPHGKGIRYCDDSGEPLYEGEFKHGLYDGEGTLYGYSGGSQCNGHKAGSYYRGTFSKGMKHGKIIHRYIGENSNTYYMFDYKMGVMDGEYITIQDNKQMIYGVYKNGVSVEKPKSTADQNIMYDDDGNRV